MLPRGDLLAFIALVSIGGATALSATPNCAELLLRYPETRREQHPDNLSGRPVNDPYQWMELESQSAELKKWIAQQNDLSSKYLETLPLRPLFGQRLREILSESAPQSLSLTQNGIFFLMRAPSTDQAALYFVAMIIRYPELFAAAISSVGVLDLLQFPATLIMAAMVR